MVVQKQGGQGHPPLTSSSLRKQRTRPATSSSDVDVVLSSEQVEVPSRVAVRNRCCQGQHRTRDGGRESEGSSEGQEEQSSKTHKMAHELRALAELASERARTVADREERMAGDRGEKGRELLAEDKEQPQRGGRQDHSKRSPQTAHSSPRPSLACTTPPFAVRYSRFVCVTGRFLSWSYIGCLGL